MNDTLVFDIETQNFFTDHGVGWNNFDALNISVVGIYSYEKNEYACLEESEMEKLGEFFRNAGTLIGFSMNRYDVPVLNRYLQKLRNPHELDLWKKERIDLLEDIETATGKRVSLSKLAEANLGVSKDRHGSEAAVLYRTGQIEELKRYCLKDVELTKQLYDLYKKQGYLLFPDFKTNTTIKVRKPETYGIPSKLFS